MKQQYILNLTNFWLYFVGRGNMAAAAFFRDLRAWDWSFCFFVFNFPSSFPHPPRTLTSCFRDDVVTFCEGTAYTSTENKHYSCFLHFCSISLRSSSNVSDAGIGPVIFSSHRKGVASVFATHSNSEATLASNPFTGRSVVTLIGLLVCVLVFLGFFCFTVRLCFFKLVKFWLFPVNNVKVHPCIFLL